jgi:3-hydroxyacyl-[acyl-carrier-protein] dehydratase
MQVEYFRLVDRIVAVDTVARSIHAQAHVPAKHTIFEGHFPDLPLLPGVLLLEIMAQASGWLILTRTKFSAMPLLAAFKEAKLRSFVKPGTVLNVTARIQHEGSGFAVTQAEVKRDDDRVVCNAEITFRLVPHPTENFLANLKLVGASIGVPIEAPADG